MLNSRLAKNELETFYSDDLLRGNERNKTPKCYFGGLATPSSGAHNFASPSYGGFAFIHVVYFSY